MYPTTRSVLACLRSLYLEQFTWLPPPYEYEEVLMPIDILSGSSRLRETIDGGSTTPTDVERLAEVNAGQWWEQSRPCLLYA